MLSNLYLSLQYVGTFACTLCSLTSFVKDNSLPGGNLTIFCVLLVSNVDHRLIVVAGVTVTIAAKRTTASSLCRTFLTKFASRSSQNFSRTRLGTWLMLSCSTMKTEGREDAASLSSILRRLPRMLCEGWTGLTGEAEK